MRFFFLYDSYIFVILFTYALIPVNNYNILHKSNYKKYSKKMRFYVLFEYLYHYSNIYYI